MCKAHLAKAHMSIFAKGAGQTFGDLPVVPIGRARRRHFVIAGQANQSCFLYAAKDCFAHNDGGIARLLSVYHA